MSSSCSSSGIDRAIWSARSNSASDEPNGRAAARRARNRGVPSNSGAIAATKSGSDIASRRAASRVPTSAASVRRHGIRREKERHVVAPPRIGDAEIHRDLREEAAVGLGSLEIELEAIVAGHERALEEIADPAVGIGERLGHPYRGRTDGEPVQRHPDPFRRSPPFRVQHVGRDRRLSGRLGHRYPPSMSDLQIRVGDLNFTARWEAAAPRTIEAIKSMLPIEAKLIHCRWTGESTWIPFGDFRPGLEYENQDRQGGV